MIESHIVGPVFDTDFVKIVFNVRRIEIANDIAPEAAISIAEQALWRVATGAANHIRVNIRSQQIAFVQPSGCKLIAAKDILDTLFANRQKTYLEMKSSVFWRIIGRGLPEQLVRRGPVVAPDPRAFFFWHPVQPAFNCLGQVAIGVAHSDDAEAPIAILADRHSGGVGNQIGNARACFPRPLWPHDKPHERLVTHKRGHHRAGRRISGD